MSTRPPTPQSETVTILKARGQLRLTKTCRNGKTEGYPDRCKRFTVTLRTVGNIVELSDLLSKLENAPQHCIIRGALRRAHDPAAVLRRKSNLDKEDPTCPHFVHAPRAFLCVDVDNLVTPDSLDPMGDPISAIEYAVSKLGEPFQGVSFHYQWSSSMGVPSWGKLKLHLWFWLDRRVDDASLRAWAERTEHADPALYSPAQIHYTAAPLFVDMADPLEGCRSGLVKRARDVVVVPESIWKWAEIEAEERERKRQERVRDRESRRRQGWTPSTQKRQRWLAPKIDEYETALIAAGEGDRHRTIVSVAGGLWGPVSWGWMDEADALAILSLSALASDPNRSGEIQDVWEWVQGQEPPAEPVLRSEFNERQPGARQRWEPPGQRQQPDDSTCPPTKDDHEGEAEDGGESRSADPVRLAIDELEAAIGRVEALDADSRHDAITELKKMLLAELFTHVALVFNRAGRHWDLFFIRLNEDLGVPKSDLRRLERRVKDENKEGEGDFEPGWATMSPKDGDEIAPIWPLAPVPAGTRLPPGYIAKGGRIAREIVKIAPDGTPQTQHRGVSDYPLVVSCTYWDIHEGIATTRISWKRNNGWQGHVVPRSVLASASTKGIVSLADNGLAVTTTTAKGLVDYLAAFEFANMGLIPRAEVSSRMGWQGKDRFLWGHHLITPEGIGAPIYLGQSEGEELARGGLAFHGNGIGSEQLAHSCSSEGTFEQWRAAMLRLKPFPLAALAIYTALATPLLEVVGAKNFVVDWSYPTSSGKTTALILAAACWGNPDKQSPAPFLHSWDETNVWMEVASSVLSGMPIMLDDTKRLKKYPQRISDAVYAVADGQGRGRGAKEGGLRAKSRWRTILMSSGEEKITNFSSDGGTRGRALVAWGQVFGDLNQKELVEELELDAREHFGHAGPRFVRWLLLNRARWGEWKARHKELRRFWTKWKGTAETEGGAREATSADSVKGRMADYFATIHLCAELVAEGLDLDLSPPPESGLATHLPQIWAVCTQEAEEADRATVAMAQVVSWAYSRYDTFYRGAKCSRSQPSSGWSGRWDGGYISFFPNKLEEALGESAAHHDAMLSLWKERGWIHATTRKFYHQRNFEEDARPRFVSIREEALIDLGLVEKGYGDRPPPLRDEDRYPF